MVLNPARPSNPFSLTTEPDWVMVGRAKDYGYPERNSSIPPAPPSRRGDRRLPPPANDHPDKSRNALTLATSHGSETSTATMSPLSPSNESDIRRKPAPPVPKKPALLSSPSTGASNSPRRILEGASGDRVINTSDRTVPPPAPPRRTASGTTLPRNRPAPHSSSLGGIPTSSGQRPPSALQRPHPPSRRDGDSSSSPSSNLLDEDIVDGGTIPSLKPLRPG